MVSYKLGDRVRFTDFLVRAHHMDYDTVLKIADRWHHLPEKLRKEAERERERYEADGTLQTRNYARSNYKAWVPAALRYMHPGDPWFSVDNRHNPTPDRSLLKVPIEGFITQRYTMQDGKVFGDEYGMSLDTYATTTGYKIAYNINRRPLLVHPSMIKRIEDE